MRSSPKDSLIAPDGQPEKPGDDLVGWALIPRDAFTDSRMTLMQFRVLCGVAAFSNVQSSELPTSFQIAQYLIASGVIENRADELEVPESLVILKVRGYLHMAHRKGEPEPRFRVVDPNAGAGQ